RLQVTRGRLSFNGPISDPRLDIRAERRIEAHDITAGISVTGRASAPQVQIWTDPASDDSQALSWLALGRPLSNLSSSEGRRRDTSPAPGRYRSQRPPGLRIPRETPMTARPTVLLCDDSRALRMLAAGQLDEAGFQVVGEAGNGLQAVEQYRTLRPDLVLLDLVMPECDGRQALARI